MKYFFILLLTFVSHILFSQKIELPNPDLETVNLKDYYFHFEDTTDQLSFDEVRNQTWKKIEQLPSFPNNQHIRWLKFELQNSSLEQIERWIFIPYHFIHEIDIYTESKEELEHIISTGTKRDVRNKHLESLGYYVRLEVLPKSSMTVYMRFSHIDRPLRATSFLISRNLADNMIASTTRLIWFWRGVYVFAIVIAFILFWALKIKQFLYYCFFNLSFGLYVAAHIGDIYWFVDSDPYDITTLIDYFGVSAINVFFPLFLNSMTPIKERNRTAWKWMYYFIYGTLFLSTLNLFPFFRTSTLTYITHFYLMYLTGIVFILQPIFIVKSIIHKDNNAIFLFLIYSFFIVSAFKDTILPNMGLVEDSPFIYNLLFVGSFIEIFCFMFLMGKESLNIYIERATLMSKERGHQKELILSIVKGQEEERNRVGRELHDLIGANMAFIKHNIGNEKPELRNILSNTIESVRNLSHGLVTPMVKNSDFEYEIREMAHLIENDSLNTNVLFYKWPSITNQKITTHLYRICQELMQNGLKHSRASNINLQFLGITKYKISVMYEDNGLGFDMGRVKQKGMGLSNIESRIEILNGELSIDSNEIGNGGTTIILEIELSESDLK
ncbi:MAG: hypothetical protein JXR07_10355 [Reichenbachiella sp.]